MKTNIFLILTLTLCLSTSYLKAQDKEYDMALNVNDEIVNKLFKSFEYPKFLYKIPGRINIDPLNTKDLRLEKEMGIEITPQLLEDAINSKKIANEILKDIQTRNDNSPEIEELKKLSETDIIEYLEKGTLELRSMEIFRFEIYLNTPPQLNFDNNSIELRDVNLMVVYEIRIHYKIGPIKSKVDFNTSGQNIQSTIKLNTIKEGSKLSVKPQIDRLKLIFKVAGIKVTLNMLNYFKPDFKQIELVDVTKLIFAIPYINTNAILDDFDLITKEGKLSLGIIMKYE